MWIVNLGVLVFFSLFFSRILFVKGQSKEIEPQLMIHRLGN